MVNGGELSGLTSAMEQQRAGSEEKEKWEIQERKTA
jgi:hypothetical protein